MAHVFCAWLGLAAGKRQRIVSRAIFSPPSVNQYVNVMGLPGKLPDTVTVTAVSLLAWTALFGSALKLYLRIVSLIHPRMAEGPRCS